MPSKHMKIEWFVYKTTEQWTSYVNVLKFRRFYSKQYIFLITKYIDFFKGKFISGDFCWSAEKWNVWILIETKKNILSLRFNKRRKSKKMLRKTSYTNCTVIYKILNEKHTSMLIMQQIRNLPFFLNTEQKTIKFKNSIT